MPLNPTDPRSEHHAIDSIRDRLAQEWSRLKDRVQTTFHKLTKEDVDAVGGRYDELSHRIAKTYGYDRDRTDDEISRFVSEGGNSAPYAAMAEEAGDQGQVTTVTFEERAGQTLLVMHDLYPSKEALDEAIASGATSGTSETCEQLDGVLASQAAGAALA